MCTAITYKTKNSYFGRNLDLEYSYDEKVVVTPRNYKFKFRKTKDIKNHYAIIGMATVADNYPLYYDGANEFGLAMAGLNFPDNAHYFDVKNGKENICPFEFIPWILSSCKTVCEAEKLLLITNLCNINFSDDFPLSPLHFIISDKEKSITVESTKDGLKIYENKVGVLTNNPTFDYHITRLCDFMNLTNVEIRNNFENIEMAPYSKGMGAIGLPGDFSSSSRFVKACFVKFNSICGKSEEESVSQFFRILNSVAMPKGCVKIDDKYEITLYSSCINQNEGIYYYTTYENSTVNAVDMKKCNLDSDVLCTYQLKNKLKFNIQN